MFQSDAAIDASSDDIPEAAAGGGVGDCCEFNHPCSHTYANWFPNLMLGNMIFEDATSEELFFSSKHKKPHFMLLTKPMSEKTTTMCDYSSLTKCRQRLLLLELDIFFCFKVRTL